MRAGNLIAGKNSYIGNPYRYFIYEVSGGELVGRVYKVHCVLHIGTARERIQFGSGWIAEQNIGDWIALDYGEIRGNLFVSIPKVRRFGKYKICRRC